MSTQRIILAFMPRFLREALKRIIDKSASLELAALVDDPQRLPSVIEETDAEWVILPLGTDGAISNEVNELLLSHPTSRFLAIAADASQVKIRSLEPHDEEFMEISLDELVSMLCTQHDGY
jgi:hypothetical protein